MAKAKQAAVGDNSNEGGPAPDAVLAINFAKFLRAEDDFDAAKAERKDAREHVDGKGLNVKAATIARGILKQGSVATASYVQLFADVLKLLAVGGAAVTSDQLDMFQVEDARTPLDERAFNYGRTAAFFDKTEGDNPYDPSSGTGQRWIAGHRQGCTEVDLIKALEPKESERIAGGEDEPVEEPFADAAE